jgi:pimeloyl-ACP methyl ester carboxylesterase
MTIRFANALVMLALVAASASAAPAKRVGHGSDGTSSLANAIPRERPAFPESTLRARIASKTGKVVLHKADRDRLAAATDPAELYAPEPTIDTGADFAWSVTLHIQNPASMGLYVDSLSCDIEDLDPGETHAGRHTTVNLTPLIQLIHSVPAEDSTVFEHSGPAVAELARLTYHLHCHRADGRVFEIGTTVDAVPVASKEYASQFLDSGGSKVEYVIVPALGGSPSSAGILLVHGEGTHARHMIRTARQLASRGFTVALVSMPGFGQSQGAPELMGPASVDAADKVLEVLEHTEGVDSKRLGAWGQSRGATVVAALAARRGELKAVVLQSGIYDLWATYRGTGLAGFQEMIMAEAGQDSAAWKKRSPLLDAKRIHAPVLVLHGEKDSTVPPAQAHALVATLQQAGTPVESHFVVAGGHQLPLGEAQRTVMDFLGRKLGPSGAKSATKDAPKDGK